MNRNADRLEKHLDDVFIVAPTDLGNPYVTGLFRRMNVCVKRMPFLVVIPVSIVFSIILYLLFGYVFIRLASILQYGF